MNKGLLRDAVRIETCTSRRAEGRLQVEMVVGNHHDRPIFVVDRVRRIHLDQATGVLHLWFSDTGRELRDSGPLHRQYSVPRARTIDQGRARTIEASLPEDMTRLVVHDDGTFHLEALDLSQAHEVAVHLAVGTRPFYFRPSEESLEAQLSGWGADITTQVAISAPGAGDKEQRKPDEAS